MFVFTSLQIISKRNRILKYLSWTRDNEPYTMYYIARWTDQNYFKASPYAVHMNAKWTSIENSVSETSQAKSSFKSVSFL